MFAEPEEEEEVHVLDFLTTVMMKMRDDKLVSTSSYYSSK
jgi:hypothetical protein